MAARCHENDANHGYYVIAAFGFAVLCAVGVALGQVLFSLRHYDGIFAGFAFMTWFVAGGCFLFAIDAATHLIRILGDSE